MGAEVYHIGSPQTPRFSECEKSLNSGGDGWGGIVDVSCETTWKRILRV